MASPALAAGAYAKLARLGEAGGGASSAKGSEGANNFGAMLKDALGAVVEAGKRSDAQGQAFAAGKANVVDVVTAVAETEVAVDALVSVRDRVIQAYEEIMRMPI